MTEKGTIDETFDISDYEGEPYYVEIEHALRRNGIAILRKGNRNKLEFGRDGRTLVIYGNTIYSDKRDKEYISPVKWVNGVVSRVKGVVRK